MYFLIQENGIRGLQWAELKSSCLSGCKLFWGMMHGPSNKRDDADDAFSANIEA